MSVDVRGTDRLLRSPKMQHKIQELKSKFQHKEFKFAGCDSIERLKAIQAKVIAFDGVRYVTNIAMHIIMTQIQFNSIHAMLVSRTLSRICVQECAHSNGNILRISKTGLRTEQNRATFDDSSH